MNEDSYAGKIAIIDLFKNKIRFEYTKKYVKKFLGGKGINIWLLYKYSNVKSHPLDPESPIIVGTGPLTGTLAPGSGRIDIAAKNYYTKGIGYASACGYFGLELKMTGFDHIVVYGRAEKPVYIQIINNNINIIDAHDLWSLTTWETESSIKRDNGELSMQVLSIGPAGENLVKGANIITHRDGSASHCGLGAVMGSKNLKAIAVKGNISIELHNPDKYYQYFKEIWNKITSSKGYKDMKKFGALMYFSDKGEAQVKNNQDAFLDQNMISKILPQNFLYKKLYRGIGYYMCPVSCRHYLKTKYGILEGPKTNGMHDFVSRLGIYDIDEVIKLNALCNKMGLDIDFTSNVIAWSIEAYEKGVLNIKDFNGLKPRWGDPSFVEEMINKIVKLDDIGRLLAMGVAEAARVIGRDSLKFAMHIKGHDLYEAFRARIGYGLGAATAPRGGGHLDGSPLCEFPRLWTKNDCIKVYGIENCNNGLSYEGKAKIVFYHERLKYAIDSMGICYFFTIWGVPDYPTINDYCNLLNAAIGSRYTPNDLMYIGERILNVAKAYNSLHAGFKKKDDYPPQRFLSEPIKSGPYKGVKLSKRKWDKLLEEYYALHGWDTKTSLQKKEKLIELGLKDVALDLIKYKKIVM